MTGPPPQTPCAASGSRPREPIPQAYRLSTYQYDLPDELIAQEPSHARDQSRLLVLDRSSGRVEHKLFHNLPSLLRPSDLLVLNETRVIPASLVAHKFSGGRVEILVLDPAGHANGQGAAHSAVRVCMVKSSKPLRRGTGVTLGSGPELTVEEIIAPGRVAIRFPVANAEFLSFLNAYGRPPLPPYIKNIHRDMDRDRSRYQTVYATVPGSVAAPTAGLHFSEALLGQLSAYGIEIARVVLHVGPGTFLPVRHEDIRLHAMESETYEISEEAARKVNAALKEARRIIAVGTTTVRALESSAMTTGMAQTGRRSTNLFIVPGHRFRVVQGLITNFHLPGSTLLMLVCAFGGTDKVLAAYQNAVENNFRFYSYGDACLIIDELPQKKAGPPSGQRER